MLMLHRRDRPNALQLDCAPPAAAAAMASMLIAGAPPVGGDTCFCDCYAMWEGLPREVKDRVRHLSAVHVGTVGHQMDGVTPVAVHPVARTHPETGRTTLYVQQGFVRRFAPEHEVPEDEARELLLRMKFQEGRAEYTCRLRWEPARWRCGTTARRCIPQAATSGPIADSWSG